MLKSLQSSTEFGMISVRVHALRAEALNVISLDLRPLTGETLPAFKAGSHIDLEVPLHGQSASFIRQYSLCNSSQEQHRYVVGVGRDPSSRGGSNAIHDTVRLGDTLRISAPRNHFSLNEDAPHSVLIAGGIGITPILGMVRRLFLLGRAFTLYYCVRTPSRAAFIEELMALTLPGSPGRLMTVFDGMPGVERLDLEAIVKQAPVGSHLYCCGPAPMMKSFEQATRAFEESHVHVEWFSAPVVPVTKDQNHETLKTDGVFTVQLKRKGTSFTVPADKTILDVLLEGGIDVDHSCREGLCGSCETRVLAGVPDHRDTIFSNKKDPPLDKIMVCVSRCTGQELVLDL
jgi:vanillate O-demethylase ferredoxin subunit